MTESRSVQRELESVLKRYKEILHWRVTSRTTEEWQQLWWSEQESVLLDQSREARESEVRLWISVRLGDPLSDDTTPPEYQGESEVTLRLELPLQAQIESLIATARATRLKYWKPFPSGTSVGPTPTVDQMAASPEILENPEQALSSLEAGLMAAVRQNLEHPQRPSGQREPSSVQFHSAETALIRETRSRVWSEGVESLDFSTSAYAEVAVSSTSRGGAQSSRSDEYLHIVHGVSVKDLKLNMLISEAMERAQEMILVEPTRGGTLPVIFGPDVIAEIIGQSQSQLSSASRYLKLPVRAVGESWLPDAETLFSLELHPEHPGRIASNWLSDQGVREAPVTLVKDNCVMAHMTDAQHGAYLGVAPTTAAANLVLSVPTSDALPGDRTELIQEAIRRFGGVLEIVQLSGLFVDSVSTNFGSEIRLARWWNSTGQVERWKGGSVSGSLLEHFRDALACRSIGDYQRAGGFHGNSLSYRGPEAICLMALPVTGATDV